MSDVSDTASDRGETEHTRYLLEQIGAQIKAGFDDTKKELLNAGMSSIHEVLKECTEIIDRISSRIDRISSTVDTNIAQIDRISERISENGDELRSLTHRVSQIKIEIPYGRPRSYRTVVEFNTPEGPITCRVGPMT